MAEKGRVVRYQADRTNQKFYFCRLACVEAAETSVKQEYQAHCETAIFHLHGAYHAFLQELANFYSLDTTMPNPEYLKAALAEKTLISPELIRLEQSIEYGVLANIMKAYQRCKYAPAPNSPGMDTSNKDSILNVVTLSNQWLPDEQTIREWRKEFMALIDELRAGMVEF